jgi:hypothetical protein
MKKKTQSLINRGLGLKLREKYVAEMEEIEKKLGSDTKPDSFGRKLFNFITNNTEVKGSSDMTPEKKKLLKRWHFLSDRVDDSPDPSEGKFP